MERVYSLDLGSGNDSVVVRITGHADTLTRLLGAVERACFEELGKMNMERVSEMPETMKKGGCSGCPQP